MPKYRVTMFFNASKTVEVEADSSEEAIDTAIQKHGEVSLCWQCSREVEDGLQPSFEHPEIAELIEELGVRMSTELDRLRADLEVLEQYAGDHIDIREAEKVVRLKIARLEAEAADPWREARGIIEKWRRLYDGGPLWDPEMKTIALFDHLTAERDRLEHNAEQLTAENDRLAARVAELEAAVKAWKDAARVWTVESEMIDTPEMLSERIADLCGVKPLANMQPPFEGPIVGFDMGKPGGDKTAIVIERTSRPHDRITMQRRIKMQRRELRRLNKSIDAGIWHTRYLVETLKQANGRVAELEKRAKELESSAIRVDFENGVCEVDSDKLELDPARVLATAANVYSQKGMNSIASMCRFDAKDAKPYRLKGGDGGE